MIVGNPILMGGSGGSGGDFNHIVIYYCASSSSTVYVDSILTNNHLLAEKDSGWAKITNNTISSLDLTLYFRSGTDSTLTYYLYLYDNNGTQLDRLVIYMDYSGSVTPYTITLGAGYYIKMVSVFSPANTAYVIGIKEG